MSESDEDVELEHSPLYQYMKEYGLESEEHGKDPAASYWKRLIVTKAGFLKRLFGHLKRAFGASVSKVDTEPCWKEHLRVILNCSGLVEEDASFLANVLNDDENSPIKTTNVTKESFFSYCYRFGIPLAILCSYGIVKLSSSKDDALTTGPVNMIFRASSFALLASSTGYLIVSLVKEMMSWKRKTDIKASLRFLEQFVQSCETSLKCLKRSLRFIQEFDIIGRGLLMTVPGSSVERLESSRLFPQSFFLPKSCQCLPLRRCTFRVARKQIRAVRAATRNLVESNPLRPEVDSRVHYVAFMQENEFGPLVTTAIEDDDDLDDVTGHFSVSAIKSVSQLYCVQLSEFLRRLALCFHPPFSTEPDAVKGMSTIVKSALPPLCDQVDRNCIELQESYEFTQLFFKTSQRPDAKITEPKTPFDLRTALRTAVRSLDLHLKVSIARINDFAEELNEYNSNDEEQYAQLNSQLELLNGDLLACNSCYDECCIRLIKLMNKEEPLATGLAAPTESENGSNDASRNPLMPILSELERLDYAQEDQIFEAYSEEPDHFLQDLDDQVEMDIRRKTREEKAASKILFNELKSVLVSKAEEWAQREAKAGGVKLPESADGTPVERTEVTDDEDSDDGEVKVHDRSYKSTFEEQMSTSFATNIAKMAVERSKMLNLDTVLKTETFETNEDCFGDSSSDDCDN